MSTYAITSMKKMAADSKKRPMLVKVSVDYSTSTSSFVYNYNIQIMAKFHVTFWFPCCAYSNYIATRLANFKSCFGALPLAQILNALP